MLDYNYISRGLIASGISNFNLEILDTVDSTNNYLLNKNNNNNNKINICIAETQTAGRGRLDRVWYSPPGENIYCSVGVALLSPLGLSLIAGIALAETLNNLFKLNIKLKWPNDLYHNSKKLGGLLIDISQLNNIVIGFGINVNLEKISEPINQPYTSLFLINQKKYNRNEILVPLISNLLNYLDTWQKFGFDHFTDKWQKLDFLYNKNIQIKMGDVILNGTSLGIDNNGLLKLKTKNNQIKLISSGDIIV